MSFQSDNKNFRGKDIDLEDQKFEPFPCYRLKETVFITLERIIVPQKLDLMVANLEYIGSRKMADLDGLEIPGISFITNEFSRDWLTPGAEAYMTDVTEIMGALKEEPDGDFSIPFLIPSMHDDANKVAILISPQCFEKNPEQPDRIMLN